MGAFLHMEMLTWVCVCLCRSVHLCSWVSYVNKCHELPVPHPTGCLLLSAYHTGSPKFFIHLNLFEPCDDPMK